MRFFAAAILPGLAGCVFSDPGSCATLCAERAVREAVDGWCPLEADATCEETCQQAQDLGPDVAAALEVCATTDPLCFVFYDTCLLNELHNGPVAHSIRVVGRDLGAFEGRTVWLLADDDPITEQQAVTVTQGGFDHMWITQPRAVDWTLGVHFATGVDACDPSADLMGTTTGELVDVTVPAWDFVVGPQTGGGSC